MTSLKSEKKIPKLINIPNKKEYNEIVRLAKKYAGGNFTKWMIVSALNYRPKKR